MTIASDLLQRHFQTLVQDNSLWQTLIAWKHRTCNACHGVRSHPVPGALVGECSIPLA